MTTVYTAISSLIVAILTGVILDYIRNGRAKIVWSVKDAVPITLEDPSAEGDLQRRLQRKTIGAYVVSLKNPSKRVVKEVECHIESSKWAKLKNGGVSAPQGMQYKVQEEDGKLIFSAPYLNKNETVSITVVAEADISVLGKLSVAVRSPHELRIVESGEKSSSSFISVFTLASIITTGFSVGFTLNNFFSRGTDTRSVLVFAATISDLPHLAEVYATESNVNYYNQGDLACALAAPSPDITETNKYRKFLSVVLKLGDGMHHSSQSNLYYCRGKLDLKISDNASALQDFKHAIDLNSGLVKEKAALEKNVSDFIAANSIQ